jgi:hypothetical protein
MTSPVLLNHELTLSRSRFSQSGLTLIELLVFVFWISCAVFGAVSGIDYTRELTPPWQVLGLLGGGAVGGLSGITAIFAFMLLISIPSTIRRAQEPAKLTCKCNDTGAAVAPHLLPTTQLDHDAISASRRWAELHNFAHLHLNLVPAEDKLRSRLATGQLTEEQLSLAACLGESAAAAIVPAPTKPLVNYRHWDRLPHDLELVLHSGLPPRMYPVWSMSCAARALAAFEREFHQDTRPRQKLGLAVMALLDDVAPEVRTALIEWKRGGTYSSHVPDHGCRVLHRTLWQRISGSNSRGEYAREAVLHFASNTAEFFSPDRLWYAYLAGDVANAYETPRNRAVWSLPSFGAQEVAHAAALAAASQEEEYALQRTELARMILAWPRWSEDRDDWTRRVETEFIPKIQENAAGLPFNIPKYIALVRELHTPWSTARSLQRPGESPIALR